MSAVLRTLIVSAVVAVASPALVAADTAADPVLGRWNLNLAKSKFSPGPAPKSQTRTYMQTPQGMALTWKIVSADGKESLIQTMFKLDGKDYPVQGSADFDSLVGTQVDALTVDSSQKRAGKIVATTRRTVAKDSKTLTLRSKGTSADGKTFSTVAVFDRQ